MVNSVREFELRKKIQEALKSGRYFITVTTLDEETSKLQHYIIYNDFPDADLIPSLSYIATDIDEKVNGVQETAP